MTLDGETVTGEYHEVFDVLYNDKGQHIENVVFAPQSSLEQGGLSLDQGDVQDFRHRLPFVLTSDEIGGIQHSLRRPAAGRRTALLCLRRCAQTNRRQEALLSGTHLGRRPRLPDREDLRAGRSGNSRHQEKGQGRASLSEVHHLAPADRRQILVPHLHPSRRHTALQR